MENENELEKPKITKEELFKENPEAFLHLEDLVCGLVKGERGLAVFTNSHITRGEATKALAELQISLTKTILHIDALIAQDKASKIVKPNNGGILNFARGRR